MKEERKRKKENETERGRAARRNRMTKELGNGGRKRNRM